MNNVELMLLSIEQNPDDLTAVAALTDLLIEERDMLRSEADKHAEKVVNDAREGRDMKAAATLLQRDRPWHNELHRDILEACGLVHSVIACVILVPGDRVPAHKEVEARAASGWWTHYTVTVGARWVLRHWRANPSLCLTPTPPKAKRTKPRRGNNR